MRKAFNARLLRSAERLQVNQLTLEFRVTEVTADLTNRNPVFEQMGCKTVPQGVYGKGLLHAAAFADDAHGHLHGRTAHGFVRAPHRLSLTNPGLFPATSHTGKKPLSVFMMHPKSPQAINHLRTNRYLACFIALAVAHSHNAAPGIDVSWPEMERLAQTQSTMINQGEDSQNAPHARRPKPARLPVV